MLKEKLINRIPSDYVRGILKENPDWLSNCGYFELACEFSKSLDERLELYKELLTEWNNFRNEERYVNINHKENLERHIEIITRNLNALKTFDRNKSELLMRYRIENKSYDPSIHKPFLSLSDAKQYIKEKRENDEHDDILSYILELYTLKHDVLVCDYAYSLDRNGEIQETKLYNNIFDEDSIVYSYGDGLYIPVPYNIGDILCWKETSLYCIILGSEQTGYLDYLEISESGHFKYVSCWDGFYSSSGCLEDLDYWGKTYNYTDIVLHAQKTDKTFTDEAEFINELIPLLKKYPEFCRKDYLQGACREYSGKELLEKIKNDIR